MFKGKAIYNPSGKAQEYSEWAVNFFNGCSGDCSYCYCKKYPMSQYWSNTPTLKKGLVDEKTAIKIFEKELIKNLPDLQEHGLFFNFSSDPFLPEATLLNTQAMRLCFINKVPVKVLTKQTDQLYLAIGEMINNETWLNYDLNEVKKYLAVGFTLTGRNQLEPGCSLNEIRIKVMKKLNILGIKTFASIEPVINMGSSLEMVEKTVNFCNHYKIGLQSGVKYDPKKVKTFIVAVNFCAAFGSQQNDPTIYWKDSLLKAAGMSRDELPSNCVGRDYNLFE